MKNINIDKSVRGCQINNIAYEMQIECVQNKIRESTLMLASDVAEYVKKQLNIKYSEIEAHENEHCATLYLSNRYKHAKRESVSINGSLNYIYFKIYTYKKPQYIFCCAELRSVTKELTEANILSDINEYKALKRKKTKAELIQKKDSLMAQIEKIDADIAELNNKTVKKRSISKKTK